MPEDSGSRLASSLKSERLVRKVNKFEKCLRPILFEVSP